MIPALYFLYLILSFFIISILSKLPKKWQFFGLLTAFTLMGSLQSPYNIFHAINDLIAGKITLPEFLWNFFHAYFVSWDNWDNELAKATGLIAKGDIRGWSGLFIFLPVNLLYIYVTTEILFWVFNSLRVALQSTLLKVPQTPEEEQKQRFKLFIGCLIFTLIIGYIFTHLDGFLGIFKLLHEKISIYKIPLNNTVK